MRRITQTTLLATVLVLGSSPAIAQANLDVGNRVDTLLGLESSRILDLSLDGAPGTSLTVALNLPGEPVLMRLEPHSVRAPGFQVLEQGADGVLRAVSSQPVRTYRGEVPSFPGSRVSASWLDDGLHARIILPGAEEFWLQPVGLRVSGTRAGDHALYRSRDVLETGFTCGIELLPNARIGYEPGNGSGSAGGGTASAAALQIAELACDADFEYFSDYGSTGAVQSRIESIINTVNLQYENEVGISHTITTILVRTSASQPYTSTNANTLLDQFMGQWNANHGSIQRDVAQLFTGKQIDGGTIGIAYVGVVCNLNFAYGVVQSDFNGNFSCATDLTAHEAGHNWSAGHCSCTSNTMNPFITCANTFHPTFTIPEIISFRDSRTCLDDGGGTCTPASTTVGSISALTINQGRGQKAAAASVTIEDDCGNAVAGATVTATFTGGINETVNGVTNANGTVTLQTTSTKKGRLRFTVCVDSVSSGLPYDGVMACASN